MDQQNLEPDVLIVGGGPAGSTLGTLLARREVDVAIVEKGHHPRFHIGESLLPMNLPIFERLGILEQVRALGVRKPGADFTFGERADEFVTYRFGYALGDDIPDHAFEVRRSEFDRLLFETCREAGATALEGHRVDHIDLGAEGRHRVHVVTPSGDNVAWQPRFVVDASGRDAFLATRNRWKVRNPKHASAAIFAHFRGVPRRAGDDAGNISVYWFDHGWIWMIPLADDIMSVGAVCWPEYLKKRREDPAAFLHRTLERAPAAAERLAGAERVTESQVAGNYSYASDRMAGPGWLLVGDAYAFVDPVFSSGVYLGMTAAEQCVAGIEAWLQNDTRRYDREMRRVQRLMDRGLRSFSWFIYRFTTPALRTLFSNPRNFLQVEQAVISMLAGDVFRPGPVRRRLLFFRILYAVSWLLSLRQSWCSWRNRTRSARVELAGES